VAFWLSSAPYMREVWNLVDENEGKKEIHALLTR
jgi:hypothetical protein